MWTTSLVMLFPLWLGYLFDPALIWAHPEVFALFFVAPFGGAAILYWLAARRSARLAWPSWPAASMRAAWRGGWSHPVKGVQASGNIATSKQR
ncbi:hypothetical protein JMG10_18955 [Nostoc ellipsosporum NOK]|nr:hypothetical protein [Nostoc ellipsosporum NOK]